MPLPKLPDAWDHENLSDGLHYYETDEVLEYGRQCWNAAIDAALDVYFDEDTWAGEQDNTDVAIRNLKLPDTRDTKNETNLPT